MLEPSHQLTLWPEAYQIVRFRRNVCARDSFQQSLMIEALAVVYSGMMFPYLFVMQKQSRRAVSAASGSSHFVLYRVAPPKLILSRRNLDSISTRQSVESGKQQCKCM